VELKNKFSQKVKEMHNFLSGGNLFKYDANTLQSELDKDRQRRQRLHRIYLSKVAKGLITEDKPEKTEDYLIKMNSEMPLDFIRPLQDKFCIKYDEMTSKALIEDDLNDKRIAEEVGQYGNLFDVAGYTKDSQRTYQQMLRKRQYGSSSRRDLSAESSLGYTYQTFSKVNPHSTKGFMCSELSQVDPYVTIIA